MVLFRENFRWSDPRVHAERTQGALVDPGHLERKQRGGPACSTALRRTLKTGSKAPGTPDQVRGPTKKLRVGTPANASALRFTSSCRISHEAWLQCSAAERGALPWKNTRGGSGPASGPRLRHKLQSPKAGTAYTCCHQIGICLPTVVPRR